jgi:7-carboxy-7-deazaguanine synthase
MSTLRLTEIFYSLQGETRTVGLPTVFVRLTGCPLRCGYCDTAYAFSGGKIHEIDSILEQVAEYTPQYVTVTGGEPLAQPACLILLTKLCDAGYEVSLETSGAMDISKVDSRVVIVMDIKTPGSKEDSKNLWKNLETLKSTDQIKFVICNQADYEWSKGKVKEYNLSDRFQVLFSPSYQELQAGSLADWILADRLKVRFQIQLHKVLWGNKPGV